MIFFMINCDKKVNTMRRITKKLWLFFLGVIFTIFYCEFLIYYIVIVQCSWPVLNESHKDAQVLRAFILSDPHLLGPRKGHWLDKWRREWQMHRAFHTIMTAHNPEVVFVLGDLFDEGEWSNDIQFKVYVERFFELFALPDNVKMHVVPGNHDIGFHYYIMPGAPERFSKMLKASSSVQFLTIKDTHFVLLNSMAMHGDSCQLCTRARNRIDNISEMLQCSRNSSQCDNKKRKINFSRPILMQHFPLYRLSDELCTEPDAPPLPERKKPFRLKVDALSKESTEYLASKIRPRAVFGGHTHHGCLLHHKYANPEDTEFYEHSVPSFSWRNRPDPKYMLLTITPDSYAVNKCSLPKETTIAITYVILLSVTAFYSFKKRSIGRN